ncbi:hypothetical protein HOLleu_13552 [Holothuria leucospilota]|uniref:Uncharacterized protein n=1 Tax=Holothuria leucospilota TaxID=206669 RepID=A0A9Q1CD54_HOLLE|nr:hypothetical protein HOLleu_13552 [Holothuria leucospilota]
MFLKGTLASKQKLPIFQRVKKILPKHLYLMKSCRILHLVIQVHQVQLCVRLAQMTNRGPEIFTRSYQFTANQVQKKKNKSIVPSPEEEKLEQKAFMLQMKLEAASKTIQIERQ